MQSFISRYTHRKSRIIYEKVIYRKTWPPFAKHDLEKASNMLKNMTIAKYIYCQIWSSIEKPDHLLKNMIIYCFNKFATCFWKKLNFLHEY